MADLTITASAVRGTKAGSALAAATLAAGKTVYLDANGKFALADCNGGVAAALNGITLNGGDTDQPVNSHSGGDLTVQGGLTAGTFYYLSATPGGICPVADLVTGCRVIQIGYAKSATVLAVNIIDTGVTL